MTSCMMAPMRGVTHTGASPHARVHAVPLTAVTMLDGFWHDRMEANRTAGIPRLLDRLEEHGVVDNFRRRPGLEVERRGFWFTDSDLYKWMEAAAWSLASTPDPHLRARLDDLVDLVAAVQTDDGYVNTHFEADRRFADLEWSHELYCAGHLMQAAIAMSRGLQDSRLLLVATRFANLLCRELGEVSVTDAHPGVELALVELARETGDAKYRELAASLIERVTPHPDGELAGHAVRAVYLACAMADLAAEIDHPGLRTRLDELWTNLLEHASYVTGAVGGRWLGEAIGRPYELPNEGAYAETCASIASVMWSWRMLSLTGDAAIADQMELTLHNAVLAGVSLTGDEWFYANPHAFAAAREHDPFGEPSLSETIAGPFPLRRAPWRDVTCCPPNAARMLASLPGYLYGTAGDDLWVHLFASSTLEHHGWHVSVATALPWAGRVEVVVEGAPAGDPALVVRIPGWATTATVAVNGEPVGTRPGSYCELRRAWRPGDRVILDLNLEPRLVECNPRVAENRGSVAIRRGPVVYCAEGIDNQEVDVLRASVRADGLRDAPPEGPAIGLVEGLITVRAEATVPGTAWGPLYRRVGEPAERPAELCLVPYFAWANRGLCPMAIWLRRG